MPAVALLSEAVGTAVQAVQQWSSKRFGEELGTLEHVLDKVGAVLMAYDIMETSTLAEQALPEVEGWVKCLTTPSFAEDAKWPPLFSPEQGPVLPTKNESVPTVSANVEALLTVVEKRTKSYASLEFIGAVDKVRKRLGLATKNMKTRETVRRYVQVVRNLFAEKAEDSFP